MKINRLIIFIIICVCMFLLLGAHPLTAHALKDGAAPANPQITDDTAAEDEKIIEEVTVTNVEVPIRVFHKKKTVKGLTKSDFRLLVGGKETPINGFYQYEKEMVAPHGVGTQKVDGVEITLPPRLFLLIFNICDDNLDASKTLAPFFKDIFRPNDRLMVITNHYVLNDRVISNPETEQRNLERILSLERERVHGEKEKIRRRLEALIRNYLARQSASAGYGSEAVGSNLAENLIRDYVHLVRQYRDLNLNIAEQTYVDLAKYLKQQRGEKWVLNYYQVGRFFEFKRGSVFRAELLTGDLQVATIRREALEEALEPYDRLHKKDLNKLFTDSGATFHTVLMETTPEIPMGLEGILSPVHMVSDDYNMLKYIAQKTGGAFLKAKNPAADSFYQKITANDDVSYVLTYVPEPDQAGKKISVKVKDKRYKVVYWNQKLGRTVRRKLEKNTFVSNFIRIVHSGFHNNQLTLVLADFKLRPDPIDKETGKKILARIPVRIQVFDQHSRNLFDGAQVFDITDIKNGKVRLDIGFPKLPQGRYDLLVFAGDPISGKTDLAIKEINIKGGG